MPDRETVMSWLEGLARDDDWRMFHSDSEVQEIAKTALALLRDQEAVEPTKQHIEKPKVDLWYCGECGNWIGKTFAYCPWCGKAVQWSE